MDLKQKHVFITGGTKRIGRALAERFLKEHARVSVTYYTSEDEAKAFSKKEPTLFAVRTNQSKVSEIQNAVSRAIEKNGPVDILINSASQFFSTPTIQCNEEQWDTLLNTNLKAQFFFAKAVVPSMVQQGNGVIINIVDVHALHPLNNFTPYAASKAGLFMMTKNLASEWAPKIRVCAVSPGPVLMPETFTEEQTQRAIGTTLLKRLGSPQDIVEGVLFLIRNTYITGFNLQIDGGYTH